MDAKRDPDPGAVESQLEARKASMPESDSRPIEPIAVEGRKSLVGPKIVAFNELCRCGDEVWIENGGQIYRLRRTRMGKLILTK